MSFKLTQRHIDQFYTDGYTVFENLEGFPADWKTNPEALSGLSETINARASWNMASIPS